MLKMFFNHFNLKWFPFPEKSTFCFCWAQDPYKYCHVSLGGNDVTGYKQATLCSLFLHNIFSAWIAGQQVFLRCEIAESSNHFTEHLYPVDLSRIQRHLRGLEDTHFINPNSSNNFDIFLRSYLL